MVDGIFPESAEARDGWLITGSRHGAHEDHPRSCRWNSDYDIKPPRAGR
ncbi:MAG: hypothetical protein R3D85_12560 [Paracoccaceae bacterium]